MPDKRSYGDRPVGLFIQQVRKGPTGQATVLQIQGLDGVLLDTEAEGKCVYDYQQVLDEFPEVVRRGITEGRNAS